MGMDGDSYKIILWRLRPLYFQRFSVSKKEEHDGLGQTFGPGHVPSDIIPWALGDACWLWMADCFFFAYRYDAIMHAHAFPPLILRSGLIPFDHLLFSEALLAQLQVPHSLTS